MNSPGQLTIRAHFAAGHLDVQAVELVRPPVARLFIGRTPDFVSQTVPCLYTLCARAQGAASRAALAAARGEPSGHAENGALWREFLHENLWRLLLDWPPALGLPPAQAAFIAWRKAPPGEALLAATHALIAGPLQTLAEKSRHTLGDVPRCAEYPFPTLHPGATSPHPPPISISAAFHRRRADVEVAVAALAVDAPYPLAQAGGEGQGIGQCLTARGVLTHTVQMNGDCINRYCIQAPTDVHFANADGLSALLAEHTFTTPAAARRGLEQAILALDPCLPYVLEFNHA